MWTAMNKKAISGQPSADSTNSRWFTKWFATVGQRTLRSGFSLTLLLFPLAACLLFAPVSCGGKQAYVSPSHISASELNQKAGTAFLRKDYMKALELYGEALRINRSMENSDGAAVGLINIAAVYREAGDRDNASEFLNKVLEEKDTGYAPVRLAGAAFLKALLFMDLGDAGKASDWTQKARAFCGKDACPLNGKLNNLDARIALARKDYAAADAYGNAGLKSNRDLDDPEETANSLRVLAETGTRSGRFMEARRRFEEALALDKSLGSGPKVRADLMGLGRLSLKQDNKPEALSFFRRALVVSESSGDGEGMLESSEMIRQCSTEPGKN